MTPASAVDNARIAAVFEEIADLLEVQGGNPFRVRAYRNGAKAIRDLATPVTTLLEQGGTAALVAVDNIGKGVWSNTQGYSNARVDELLAMAAIETDLDKRKALYAEFQQIIAEELPVYHTNTLPYHTVYSDKVGNPPLGIWGTSTPIDMTYLKE